MVQAQRMAELVHQVERIGAAWRKRRTTGALKIQEDAFASPIREREAAGASHAGKHADADVCFFGTAGGHEAHVGDGLERGGCHRQELGPQIRRNRDEGAVDLLLCWIGSVGIGR